MRLLVVANSLGCGVALYLLGGWKCAAVWFGCGILHNVLDAGLKQLRAGGYQ